MSRRQAVRGILMRWQTLAGPALAFLAFLAVYARTAAPSVLSGDSAEFQMAAATLGVAHPTTYPLYTLLGKLATLALPFGDLAHRVTLLSGLAAALAVALICALTQHVTRSTVAALLAALALGVGPELWNAATIAEVYALLALLLAALGYCLFSTQHSTLSTQNSQHGPTRWLLLAGIVAGLGFTHHTLFAFTGLPLFAVAVLRALARQKRAGIARLVALLGACFLLGMTPWLYPFVQFARLGPFNGEDYGLPTHYFWGAPASYGQVMDLLLGGPLRGGVFRAPSPEQLWAALRLIGSRLHYNFGPLGLLLGLLGSAALLRRNRWLWAATVWMIAGTLLYLALLGPAVQDAPVFTVPMLLPWALWIGLGGHTLARLAGALLGKTRGEGETEDQETRRPEDQETRRPGERSALSRWPFAGGRSSVVVRRWSSVGGQLVLLGLLLATLGWGYTRVKYASKRQLWLFREFGQATLQALPPDAAVITHWEQGMVLQYLRLAEGQRPDVWVDVAEPGDAPWAERARVRYPGRPVFFIGSAADVAGIPVTLVQDAEYADLFQMR